MGKLVSISKDCLDTLLKIEKLQFPKMCCNVLKATDDGPGVGVSNTEVRFRDVQIVRMHSSDRANRIHRAPGDSGQSEAGDQTLQSEVLWWMEGISGNISG